MNDNTDKILDRIYLKKQITKWRTLAIFFVVVALLIVVSKGKLGKELNEEDHIARITIDGIVGDDSKLYNLISKLSDDDKVKGVIVSLDTPGGSAVGGEEIYLGLRKLSAKKPVVATMRSVSASAGYLISLGADRIYAREGTITGSIGVIIETAEVSELAAKLGIKPIEIKSAPLKAAPSPFTKSTQEAENVLHDMIMDFYNHFVDLTAQRRKLPREKAVSLADGRVYSGIAAVKNGLVDEIGGEDEAIDWLEKNQKIAKNLKVVDAEIEEDNGFFSEIINNSIGDFWQKSRVGLDGMAAIWHPKPY